MNNLDTRSPKPPGRIRRWWTRRSDRAAEIQESGRLTAAVRWALGLAGSAMAGAGTWAVFTVETEAGPAALVVIGALLFFVAIMGRQIKEVGLADGTLAYVDMKNRIRNADTPQARVDIAAAAATTYPAIQHDPEIQELSHAAYEEIVAGNLVEIFGQEAVRSQGPFDRGVDITVTVNSKKAGIETLFGPPDRYLSADRMLNKVEGILNGNRDLDAVIIVSTMHEPPLSVLGAARDRAAADGKTFQYVRWNSNSDGPQLERVLRDHLQA
ncbi:hypothetical protein ABZ891_24925 [Streptomyces sp. NPDC047023]|uniref:hypothetical protein n=1 Tax=Streptomyces sp. NPDC047023 TaxID=3155139 RepID=UPI0033F645D8